MRDIGVDIVGAKVVGDSHKDDEEDEEEDEDVEDPAGASFRFDDGGLISHDWIRY